MKTSRVLRGLALILAFIILNSPFCLRAQGQAGYAVTARGPDWKVLQKTVVVNGTNQVRRYTELATGMNYTNATGQLVEASEQITLLPGGGAVANHGRHQVYFPANIYNGILEVVTPDGRHLKSRPLGVSYDDGSNTVFIATLKSAPGYLTSSNTVTYRDAFTGFKADLVCTYRRGGFECDLVFRQQPLTPGDYGLDESFSTLQMVTEFFNTADPVQIPAGYDYNFGLQDSTLKFGKLTMTHGKAFAFRGSGSNSALTNSQSRLTPAATVPVYKSWVHSAGRTFLIEELPVLDLADDLNALPLTARSEKIEARSWKLAANNAPSSSLLASSSSRRAFPAAPAPTACTNQILLALNEPQNEPGVVLDYNTVDSDQTDFTFAADTTYYIKDVCTIGGTTTFEGGTTLKFPQVRGSAECNLSCYDIFCATSAEHPAVFTSLNDDSVGESIPGSSGTPAAGGCFYLQLNTASPLKHFRMLYAGIDMFYYVDGTPLEIRDSQFLVSGSVLDAWTASESIIFNNVLVSQCWGVVYNDCEAGSTINIQGEHLTLDQCGFLAIPPTENSIVTVSLVNSLLTDVSYTDGYYLENSEVLEINDDIYQTAGAAHYYLAPNSPYRNAGTSAINPALLAELKTMTTYALQDGSWPDNDGQPDLGYHYPYTYVPLGANGSYLTNGLVVYYKLNETNGATAHDSSGNGFNANLTNSPTWGTNYLTLNGTTQYGNAGNHADFNNQDFTVMAWIHKAHTTNAFSGILDKSDLNGHQGWGYWLDGQDRQMFAASGFTITDNGLGGLNYSNWTQITMLWHQAAQVADFYVDGLYNSGVSGFAHGIYASPSGADLQIGNLDNSYLNGTFILHGSLKHAAIYNRALSPSEIQTNFLATELYTNVTYPSLLYYKLTETNQFYGPAYFSDSSLRGAATGVYLTDSYNDIPWTNNQSMLPQSALHFHGEYTCIDTSNTVDFNFTTNLFTVNFWVRPDTDQKTLFDNNRGNSNYGWTITVGGSFYLTIANTTNLVTTQRHLDEDSIWHMVSVVRDSRTDLQVYFDGQFQTNGLFGDMTASPYSLRIGGGVTVPGGSVPGGYSTNNAYDGDMWGIQIWGQPLNPIDIANLWFRQKYGQNWP